MGIPMIVKKPFRPTGSGSAMRKVGDPYTAQDERQARLFRTLGLAEDAPPPPPELPARPPAAAVYRRRDVVPDKTTAPAPWPSAAPDDAPADAMPDDKPRRTYKRRDMAAEK